MLISVIWGPSGSGEECASVTGLPGRLRGLSFPAPPRAWVGAEGEGAPALPPSPSVMWLCPSPPLGLTVPAGHDKDEPLQAMALSQVPGQLSSHTTPWEAGTVIFSPLFCRGGSRRSERCSHLLWVTQRVATEPTGLPPEWLVPEPPRC